MEIKKSDWPAETRPQYRALLLEAAKAREVLKIMYQDGVMAKPFNPYVVRDFLPLLRDFVGEINIQYRIARNTRTPGRDPNWVTHSIRTIPTHLEALTEYIGVLDEFWLFDDIARVYLDGCLAEIRNIRELLTEGPGGRIIKFKQKKSAADNSGQDNG